MNIEARIRARAANPSGPFFVNVHYTNGKLTHGPIWPTRAMADMAMMLTKPAYRLVIRLKEKAHD